MARNIGLQIFRGLSTSLPTLMVGELALATDTHQLWVGTGAGNQMLNSSGSGGNFVQVTVDFGPTEGGDLARTTVTGQTWVTSTSILIANPFAGATIDHDPDDVIVEEIQAYAENLVTGVGFDVVAIAPNGSSGHYLINVMGK